MPTQLIKKLTAKTVLGNVREHIRVNGPQGEEAKNGAAVPGFTIIGQIIGHTTGDSDYGPWVKLKGRFRATREHDGAVFSSSSAMLPDEATDPILAALTLDEVKSVDMAFHVGLQIDDSAATGYVYTVKPLIEPSQDDPLERLQQQVTGQLPAPEKPAEKGAGANKGTTAAQGKK